MPKHNNNVSTINNNNRLGRNNGKQENHPKRAQLLEEILDASSSLALNDVSNHVSARQVLDSHSSFLDKLDELRKIETTIDPKLPSRNKQCWDNFFTWICSKQSVPFLDEKFEIVDSKHKLDHQSDDCCLATKVPFRRGDIIFNIPRHCMLTTETALEDEDLGNFIRNDSIASAMQNIALVLHVLNEHSKASESDWFHYLNIMPNKILPILSMSHEQWNQLLPSAHIYDALKMIRSISRQYTYFYKKLQSTKLPLRKSLTFKYYCWGVSIVCSRQNEIPPMDRQWCPTPVINALIPILDMCNHSHDSNQAVFEDNHSLLFAPKDIEKGEEIKINYGTRTSGEFYIHNGFVPDFVEYDMVPISLCMNRQESQYASRAKLLKILNMPTFGRFKLVANTNKMRHRRDPHLTMFLIVHLLTEEDLEMILKDQNPVGLADQIYEYVQYTASASNEKLIDQQNVDNDKILLELGKKLYNLIEMYSSKRASIGVALINRALESKTVEYNLARLLERERDIYLSYINNMNNKKT